MHAIGKQQRAQGLGGRASLSAFAIANVICLAHPTAHRVWFAGAWWECNPHIPVMGWLWGWQGTTSVCHAHSAQPLVLLVGPRGSFRKALASCRHSPCSCLCSHLSCRCWPVPALPARPSGFTHPALTLVCRWMSAPMRSSVVMASESVCMMATMRGVYPFCGHRRARARVLHMGSTLRAPCLSPFAKAQALHFAPSMLAPSITQHAGI